MMRFVKKIEIFAVIAVVAAPLSTMAMNVITPSGSVVNTQSQSALARPSEIPTNEATSSSNIKQPDIAKTPVASSPGADTTEESPTYVLVKKKTTKYGESKHQRAFIKKYLGRNY